MQLSPDLVSKFFWNTGDRIKGFYCGQPFSGSIMEESRHTPDHKNILFMVKLDQPIQVYGQERTVIGVQTNSSNPFEFDWQRKIRYSATTDSYMKAMDRFYQERRRS